MHAYIHIHLHTCMHACMHACTHTLTYIHSRTLKYIHTYIHTLTYINTLTHIHAYIHIYTQVRCSRGSIQTCRSYRRHRRGPLMQLCWISVGRSKRHFCSKRTFRKGEFLPRHMCTAIAFTHTFFTFTVLELYLYVIYTRRRSESMQLMCRL